MKNSLNGTENSKLKTSKAQIWSADLMFALTLLIFMLLIFFIMWNDLALRWNAAEKYRELKVAALYAADSLLTTRGDPENWQMLNLTSQIDQINAIGIVNERNMLSNDKLNALKIYENTSYGEIKRKLGLAKYEIDITITNKNNSITYYQFGNSTIRDKETASIERLAKLNDSLSIVKISVWSE